MAEQSDAYHMFDEHICNEDLWTFNFEELERFASLVAAAERDRIADEAQHIIKRAEARGAAAAIRARGE